MAKKKGLEKEIRKEIDMYLNMETFRETPIPEEKVVAFAQDLYYSIRKNKKMISLHHWRFKHKISYAQLSRWRKKHSLFDEIYTECLELIGERRDELALWKKLDGAHVRYTLGNYSTAVRELEEWRAGLKIRIAEKAAGSTKIQIVEIPTFAPSGKVPDKPKEETISNS